MLFIFIALFPNVPQTSLNQLPHSTCFHAFSSLKLECEKLASEKVEIQRHYVMVREEKYKSLDIPKCVVFFFVLC